jgi:hypothetical protein
MMRIIIVLSLMAIALMIGFSRCASPRIDYKVELETWICISYQSIKHTREAISSGEYRAEDWEDSLVAETKNFSEWMGEYYRRYGRFFLPEKECE